MLFREKLLVGFFAALCVVGVADLNTPYVNLFWERYLGFSGRFMILQGEKVGYVNARSRLMIAPKLEGGVSYFDKDLAPAAQSGRWGFIDVAGRWRIEPKYFTANEFHEDRALVSVKLDESRKDAPLKFGFLDRRGEMVIPAVYAEAGNFSKGLAPAKSAGVWGYLNNAGQWALEPKFEGAQEFSEGLAAVKKDGLWGYIDHLGLFLIKPQFDEVKPFKEGRAPVKKGVDWGYIDDHGRWVVEPKFRSAGVFSDGRAAVDSTGYIDREGKLVIASDDILQIKDFSEGLAAVQLKPPHKQVSGKWGYVDTRGHWVIQPRFEIARDFQGGMARVSKDRNNTQRGYIHKDGKLVWDPADWEKSANFKRFLKTVGMVVVFILPAYVFYTLRQREKQFYFLQTIS
jgi:hypothetical protein